MVIFGVERQTYSTSKMVAQSAFGTYSRVFKKRVSFRERHLVAKNTTKTNCEFASLYDRANNRDR